MSGIIAHVILLIIQDNLKASAMRVKVVNKKLPAGKNTLINVVNTFGENGDLMATRIDSHFPSEEAALKRLKELNLEPNEDIEIVPC